VTGFGLGTGPAAGIAFDGKLLTRPSGGTEAKLSDALVLTYSGVYAAPPAAPVLSPNGDGVNDTETLTYQLARPSNVVATLSGPSGTKIPLVSEAETPGPHTLTWDGTNAGTPGSEGQWTFGVTATDDRNVTTSAQQSFSLDDTLSSLTVTAGSRPTASFQLTRPASVVVRIERPNGVPVATVGSGPRSAGAQRATWRGMIGKRGAPGGRYRVEVVATSSVGTSSLAALFSFRPHTGQ
jgi:flagellar hook assembly protein FlgD